MEKIEILKWLSGSGYGECYGECYGEGYGFGSGEDDGYGYGRGSGEDLGNGSDFGRGFGEGLKFLIYNEKKIYEVDEVPTIINTIFGNYARGYIVNDDFSLTECYIAKNDRGTVYAHGKTLREANESLIRKINESLSEEERIDLFLKNFKKGEKYKGTEFFDWHNTLTGSCLFGRENFVKNKGLDINAYYSVEEFITLTLAEYGGEIMKKLKEKWEKNNESQSI